MHHESATDVQRSIRKYLMIGGALLVFTVITVAANLVHLPVAAAITVAMIIASMKASMVAGVFMHLSHEKQWVYGALALTVVFFIALMLLPIFSTMDSIATATGAAHQAAAPEAGHAGH